MKIKSGWDIHDSELYKISKFETQAFSFLCYGSALFHASATDTGGSLDVDTISILTYAIHQASVEHLRDLGASTVITGECASNDVLPLLEVSQ